MEHASWQHWCKPRANTDLKKKREVLTCVCCRGDGASPAGLCVASKLPVVEDTCEYELEEEEPCGQAYLPSVL